MHNGKNLILSFFFLSKIVDLSLLMSTLILQYYLNSDRKPCCLE